MPVQLLHSSNAVETWKADGINLRYPQIHVEPLFQPAQIFKSNHHFQTLKSITLAGVNALLAAVLKGK